MQGTRLIVLDGANASAKFSAVKARTGREGAGDSNPRAPLWLLNSKAAEQPTCSGLSEALHTGSCKGTITTPQNLLAVQIVSPGAVPQTQNHHFCQPPS